jgi:hypothetical protein
MKSIKSYIAPMTVALLIGNTGLHAASADANVGTSPSTLSQRLYNAVDSSYGFLWPAAVTETPRNTYVYVDPAEAITMDIFCPTPEKLRAACDNIDFFEGKEILKTDSETLATLLTRNAIGLRNIRSLIVFKDEENSIERNLTEWLFDLEKMKNLSELTYYSADVDSPWESFASSLRALEKLTCVRVHINYRKIHQFETEKALILKHLPFATVDGEDVSDVEWGSCP